MRADMGKEELWSGDWFAADIFWFAGGAATVAASTLAIAKLKLPLVS